MWGTIALIILVVLLVNCMFNYKRMPKGYTTPHPPNKPAEIVNKDRFEFSKVPEEIDFLIIGSGLSGL